MLFSRDDLLRLLHSLNPWWTGRVPILPRFRRPMYRACRRHLELRSEQFVLLVSGLRGTGKTTMLLQLASDLVTAGTDPRSVLYVSMGHPILSRVPLPEILQLHREMIRAADPPAVLLLDEFHYADDWDQHVKALLQDQGRYRIVATESVQMIERALVTETQVNRWSAMSSPTLSFHEYLTLRGIDPIRRDGALDLIGDDPLDAAEIDATAHALEPALDHFRTYLVSGGLPWLASHADDPGSRGVLQEDVAENILRRDIGMHFGARNIEDLKRLFVFLCMHSGEVFPVQRYARDVRVASATVASHLELLERCFLVRRVGPHVSGDRVVKKPRYRVVISDTTLRNAQLLRDEESLASSEEMQRVVATSVVRHVVERYAATLTNLRYWRDPRTGRNVELISRQEGRQTAFKVMYNRLPLLKQDDPLIAFCKSEPVQRAFIVTSEDQSPDVFRLPRIDTEFVKVPAHVLLYLFGRAESDPTPV